MCILTKKEHKCFEVGPLGQGCADSCTDWVLGWTLHIFITSWIAGCKFRRPWGGFVSSVLGTIVNAFVQEQRKQFQSSVFNCIPVWMKSIQVYWFIWTCSARTRGYSEPKIIKRDGVSFFSLFHCSCAPSGNTQTATQGCVTLTFFKWHTQTQQSRKWSLGSSKHLL